MSFFLLKNIVCFLIMPNITLSRLAKCTGLKPRTIQFWTAEGVLNCDPDTHGAGKGVAREYPDGEVAIALILSEIVRIPIGARSLKEIAERLRDIMRCGPNQGIHDAILFETSEAGELMLDGLLRRNFALREAGKHEEAKATLRKLWALRKWSDFELARSGVRRLEYEDGHDRKVEDIILELHLDDDDRWQIDVQSGGVYDDAGFPAGREAFKDFDRAPAGAWSLRLLVNLSRVFRRLPNRSQGAVNKSDPEGEVA